MKPISTALLALAGSVLATASAAQQPTCKPVAEFIDELGAPPFNEHLVAGGVSRQGVLLMVLASPDGSTWSLLAVATDGRACFLDGGDSWQEYVPPPEAMPGIPS